MNELQLISPDRNKCCCTIRGVRIQGKIKVQTRCKIQKSSIRQDEEITRAEKPKACERLAAALTFERGGV